MRDSLGSLTDDLLGPVLLHRCQNIAQLADQLVRQNRFDRVLAENPQIGETHPVGRQHAGEGMDEHARHAQRIGDQAGVLATRAAEAVEGVFGHVVTTLDRDLLDGMGHVVDRDPEKPVRHLDGCARVSGRIGNFLRQPPEPVPHDVGVQRLVAVGAEQPRKEARLDLPDHHVGVGHCQRPAAPIARGSGIGSGGIRPDPVPRSVEVQDRAAARGHGMYLEHRGPHAHAGNQCLEGAFVLAPEMSHVGGSAAHVEADDPVEARQGRGLHGTDHAARRPGQDAVLAAEVVCVRETAVGLHEQKAHAGEVARDAVHVAAQDRGHVGVHHGRVATADELHERAHLVGNRHLREADLPGEPGNCFLVIVIPVAMHEHDGHRGDAVAERFFQGGPRRLEVERHEHFAFGGTALLHLDDLLVQEVGEDDLAGEEVWPILIADAQRVPETPGDEQRGAVPLALEKRVGRNGRPHLDRVDDRGRKCLVTGQAEQVAHALQRRIFVPLGVFRKQLVGDEPAIRRRGHDVGERAAAIDPELPGRGTGRTVRHRVNPPCLSVHGIHGVTVQACAAATSPDLEETRSGSETRRGRAGTACSPA